MKGKKIMLGRKHIGTEYKQDKIFRKDVSKKIHLFRVLDAWGVDSEYFNSILLPDEYTILVVDRDEQVRYEATAKKFSENLQYFHFKNQTADHRTQVFLPRKYWSKSPEKSMSSDEILLQAIQ